MNDVSRRKMLAATAAGALTAVRTASAQSGEPATGEVIGASKTARDVTERKRRDEQIIALAQEAEHQSKNLLATVQATVRLTQADTPADLKVWDKNDPIFLPSGAEVFKRDMPEAKVRFFDTGHFALEAHCAEIAKVISDFLGDHAG